MPETQPTNSPTRRFGMSRRLLASATRGEKSSIDCSGRPARKQRGATLRSAASGKAWPRRLMTQTSRRRWQCGTILREYQAHRDGIFEGRGASWETRKACSEVVASEEFWALLLAHVERMRQEALAEATAEARSFLAESEP